ncbi:MAG TPA: hypothetical protein VGQ38_14500 [Gaiellaceae bacterium]|nr:hypothetical protein [Gaiellaceae bacterium]
MALALVAAMLLGTDGSRGAVPDRLAANALVQQGSKLKPAEGASDARFGWRVALSADGNTALVGAPSYKGRAGAAWVITRTGTTWTQQGGPLTGSGGSFGFSVALSADGDTALVGAPTSAGGAGAAWVFTRTGSTWTKRAKLTGAAEEGAAQFGWSVALSGNATVALVGGPYDGNRQGAVWTFTGSGSAWAQRGLKLKASGESGGGLFGIGLALAKNGGTALVGAPQDSGGIGAVWAYQRSSSVIQWQLRARLTGRDEGGPGAFGDSIALSDTGTRALVGGPFDSANAGAAWDFRASGSGWVQEGRKITDRRVPAKGGLLVRAARAEEFGLSVALSGDGGTALVGAPTDRGRVGSAWLFARTSRGLLGDAAMLEGGGGSGPGEFGHSAALADDGDTALVGGPFDVSSTLGATWVFANTRAVDLLGQANGRIDGAAGDQIGFAVANAGDVNSDGRPDLVVGAPGASNNGRAFSGSAYVVFGRATPGRVDLANLGAGGFRIDGAAPSDRAGEAVAAAGDVNRDGLADVIVAAPDASNNGRSDSGSVYVVFGKSSSANVDLANLGPGGYRIDGATGGVAHGDEAGHSVAAVGDLNGDDRPDMIIGAHHASNNGREGSGSAYVVFGTASRATIDLAALGNNGFRIDGAVAGDQMGWSVGSAGDVNGDGRPDVVLGAPTAGRNGRPRSGAAYVVFAKASPGTVDLAALGADGFGIDGAAAGDFAGGSVAGSADMNGDGRADVIIGAFGADNSGRADSGSAYVVFGKGSPGTVDLATLGNGGFRVDGASPADEAGLSVASAGDANGDGRTDVIVGAPAAGNNGRAGSGSAYVVFGRDSSGTVDLAALGSKAGFRIDGAAAGDRAGSEVANAGDVNHDGRADVIVGAPAADNNMRPDSGSAYLVLG